MSNIPQATWDKLIKATGDRLVARLPFPDITHKLYCGIDSHSHRHILVLVGENDDSYHDSHSRGLKISTIEYTFVGESNQKFIDIECLDENGFDVLNLIGGEICDLLAEQINQPAFIVHNVISKWRRFWGNLPSSILSKEEQIGLFTELFFIYYWLLPTYGKDAILYWKGPWGNRYDFEWGDKAIEVKGTTNVKGRIHTINGISQLECPLNGELFLFSASIREEVNAQDSLTYLVSECKNILTDNIDSINWFENGLIQAGYSSQFDEEYSKCKYHVIEQALFEVKDDFPRIIHSSFTNGVPSGVEKVVYEINLNTFNNLILFESCEHFHL
jgi:hypothetical protein